MRLVLFTLILLSLLPMKAQAELPEWVSGLAILDHYEAIEQGPNSTLQSGLTLFGNARPVFSDTLSGKLSLRGAAFRRSLEKGKSTILRGEVKELWLERDRSGFRLQIGQIITPWGRSDAVNPTDYLTAKDFRTLSTHDEIRRQGAPGFRATYVPNEGSSPLEVSVAWNARYPQTKMLIPMAKIPSGLAVENEPTSPRLFGDRQEWALKLAYLAPSWDASLSAFDGRTHFGQFVWDGAVVRLEYLKVRALGGDFSVTFDEFVLRGETAYFFYETGKEGLGGQSLTEPNHWDSVLGIERALGDRFRVIAQLLYRVHPSLRNSQEFIGVNPLETAIVRGVANANAVIQNYPEHAKLGATLLLAYASADENWFADLAAMGNFLGGDYVLRPKLGRKVTDSMRLTLGMDYYGGPTDQPFGALKDYRSVFFEGAVTF